MVRESVQMSVVTIGSSSEDLGEALEALREWLDSTKLSWEAIVIDGGVDSPEVRLEGWRVIRPETRGKGRGIAEAVMETKGEVVVVVEDLIATEPGSLGPAITLVQSDATDIALVDLQNRQRQNTSIFAALIGWIVGTFLVSDPPPTGHGATVFSRAVGRDLFSQARIDGAGVWNEFLYLARKYGYRIERLAAERVPSAPIRPGRSWGEVLDIVRTRLNDRRMRYRIPRRCPVCMSAETGTRLQIDGEIVRACRRCKCRYLSVLHRNDDTDEPTGTMKRDEVDSEGATETRAAMMTARRRLQLVCRFVPFGSRVLELGCGAGIFGSVAREDFGYSGVDESSIAVRRARQKGLNVVRGELNGYVSLNGPFDCLLAFDVMERFPDPHLAFEQIRRLIKPGGVLIVTTPDTESLIAEISGDRWLRRRFPQNRILYSRTALLELLDNEGFDVESAASELELREADELEPGVFRSLGRIVQMITRRPLLCPCGTVRIVARRRAGSALGERYEKRVAAERAF